MDPSPSLGSDRGENMEHRCSTEETHFDDGIIVGDTCLSISLLGWNKRYEIICFRAHFRDARTSSVFCHFWQKFPEKPEIVSQLLIFLPDFPQIRAGRKKVKSFLASISSNCSALIRLSEMNSRITKVFGRLLLSAARRVMPTTRSVSPVTQTRLSRRLHTEDRLKSGGFRTTLRRCSSIAEFLPKQINASDSPSRIRCNHVEERDNGLFNYRTIRAR